MKKLLGSLLAVLSLSVVAIAAPPNHYTETLPSQAPAGATPVSNGYDWTLSTNQSSPQGVGLVNQTLAQITALTPSTTGQIVFCSNCTSTLVCVATGTVGAGAFAAPSVSSGATNGIAPCK